MNSHTGALSRAHRQWCSSRRKSPVCTVQYRSFSLLARGPVLLTCTQDGNLSFFRFCQHEMAFILFFYFLLTTYKVLCWLSSIALEVQGYLTLRCSLKLSPRIHSIRASFCPLLSLEKGEYIGKDCLIFFRNHIIKWWNRDNCITQADTVFKVLQIHHLRCNHEYLKIVESYEIHTILIFSIRSEL